MEEITLSDDNIKNFIEGDIGIKHSQLMLLDEYPMKKGWKERLLGKSISKEIYDMLVRSKGEYLNNTKLKKHLGNEIELIAVYEKELRSHGL